MTERRNKELHRTERRAVTMKDIAAQVGVSKMTVSAVLSGTSTNVGVSEITRTRILTTAEQMQYRPNAIARSLRSRRTNILGFYSGYHYMDPRNAFVAEIIGGLQEGCTRYRKDLLLHTVFRQDSVEDIYSELVDGRIDGLIMTAPPEDPLVARLADSHIPVVVVADAVPLLPSVTVDDTQAAHLTLDYLLQRGHTRMLYQSVDRHLFSAERRRAAYFRVAAAKGIVLQEWYDTDAESSLQSWITSPPDSRPTAILCWNDVAAYDLLRRCHRHSVNVPEDLAITGFDGDPNPLAFQFQLTTVRAPWAEVALTAVQLLAEQIEGKEIPPETILPVEFTAGHSA